MSPKNTNLSRRVFLHRVGTGTLALTTGSLAQTPLSKTSPKDITKLTENLIICHGHINVGIVRNGDKALLIDCGDGSVTGVLGDLGIKTIDQIIFTHHQRGQAWGAPTLAASGARIGVPAEERAHFDNVAAYWNNPKHRWHIYNFHSHHLMLAEPIRVQRGTSFVDR